MSPEILTKPIVVSVGEPAGIGPDLCLGLAGTHESGPLVLIADPEQLAVRAKKLSVDIDISRYTKGSPVHGSALHVLPIDFANKDVCGTPDPANSSALLRGVERAVDGCGSGEFAALVTGPVQKSAINDAGIPFSGHTEFIAGLTGCEFPVMLLIAGGMRVALVTTHLPLRDVADSITTDKIIQIATTLHRDLIRLFGIPEPDIVVCGLNPHAGEGGHLGHEDQEVIAPAIRTLNEAGIRARGPLPADTAFTPAAGSHDAILAMYHDQGLPTLKHAGFGGAVNVTLGLPIIRSSVDHGTALDIAGTGMADAGSLGEALKIARQMAAR